MLRTPRSRCAAGVPIAGLEVWAVRLGPPMTVRVIIWFTGITILRLMDSTFLRGVIVVWAAGHVRVCKAAFRGLRRRHSRVSGREKREDCV